MFWNRRKLDRFIDPSKVKFGCVVGAGHQNLNRSHVSVKYRRESEAHSVPLATFIRHCRELMRSGRSLKIEHLLVAPILKRRHAEFFDSLTDWGPATRRAHRALPAQQEPALRNTASR